jgi:hypothetical protein
MTHENYVARALGHAHAAALAIPVVEFEAMTHSFQYAFRAIRAAKVTLVADAARQTTSSLARVFETHVYFVESRASLGRRERITFRNRLGFEKMQLHGIGANNLVAPHVDIAQCVGMLGDTYLFAA